jgi:hypothetical protein
MLAHDGNPTSLEQGFAEYGRIAKTLHLLAMVAAPPSGGPPSGDRTCPRSMT